MNRNTLAARKMRSALLEKLGAWCVLCGETDTDKLEFDHKNGRTWAVEKFSYRQRLMIYTQEEKKDLLRVLCKKCNLAERKRNDNGAFVPTASDVPLTDNIPW